LPLALFILHEAVARLLVDLGDDVSAADNEGQTPLHQTTIGEHEVVVRLLVELGAVVLAAEEDVPLHLS